jgi:hypothetical protein
MEFGNEAMRVAIIFRRLILRQAQDDGILKVRLLQRSLLIAWATKAQEAGIADHVSNLEEVIDLLID